jgi:hypothetical protein
MHNINEVIINDGIKDIARNITERNENEFFGFANNQKSIGLNAKIGKVGLLKIPNDIIIAIVFEFE